MGIIWHYGYYIVLFNLQYLLFFVPIVSLLNFTCFNAKLNAPYRLVRVD